VDGWRWAVARPRGPLGCRPAACATQVERRNWLIVGCPYLSSCGPLEGRHHRWVRLRQALRRHIVGAAVACKRSPGSRPFIGSKGAWAMHSYSNHCAAIISESGSWVFGGRDPDCSTSTAGSCMAGVVPMARWFWCTAARAVAGGYGHGLGVAGHREDCPGTVRSCKAAACREPGLAIWRVIVSVHGETELVRADRSMCLRAR